MKASVLIDLEKRAIETLQKYWRGVRPDSYREVEALQKYWRGVRVVEGARLESVYTSKAYRGFESRSLRSKAKDYLRKDLRSCKIALGV